ncbi:MAG: DUF3800 domain-containing protein [Candidatus Scalindua sediminis]|nr:DUF3800 domain-containing protein [Candidatus Scalindua sediminis]
MMKRLFLDESGECSFAQSSNCKHFLITILSVDSSENEIIKDCLKRKFAGLIRKGWDKTKELKAYDLYRNKKYGAESIKEVIQSLVRIKSLEISYLIVNKDKITNESFKNAEYGIAYNYFTGVILSELVFEDGFHNLYLIHDIRNKETHSKKYFKEHLETKILGKALEKGVSIEIQIEGLASDKCYGLSAVDFFSWAIFRKFEHSDDRFYNLLVGKLKRRREWYVKK